MKEDFLGEFMGGNTARSRLLRVFMFDAERSFPLKDAAKRAGITPQAASKEVKVLETWGLVKKGKSATLVIGNGTARKVSASAKVETWAFDPEFKYARALTAFVREISPMRYESVVAALRACGKVSAVVLSGSFTGDDTRPVDILVVGEDVSEQKLARAIKALEPVFGRELRYTVFTTPEFRYRLTIQDRLVRDTFDFPHLVLFDRFNIL